MKCRTNLALIVRAALVGAMALISIIARPQSGLNNLWMGGFEDESPPPWGGVNLEFNSGSMVISAMNREIDFKRTSANITDAAGNLLFSTNGAYIANATGDTMLNGGGISPSWYTSIYPEGLHLSQACMVLPKPDAPGVYYLFHGTIDDPPNSCAHFLYLTTIDMALDGGLGGVVSKNQVLIEDTLNTGKITAVRHANGRDWWVFCHKLDTDIYYRIMVTPYGVTIDGTQAIGEIRIRDVGQICFSPDGSKFAYYYGANTDLEVFNFDRCAGLLSNPEYVAIDDANFAGGVAFSPNSRFLYVSSTRDVYQYDTEADDLPDSMVHIAAWDSFYSPSPPFATKFDLAQLALDGKVYIATGNGTQHLHVINNPDEPGLACNMVQHGVALPRYFMNSLPNHPNYFLGPVDGSVCDSLGISALTPGPSPRERGGMRAFPNPSADGRFVLGYPAHAGVGWLEVRNLAGQIVRRERIPQWSTVHEVELQGQAAGMYQCSLRWGAEVLTTRVILTER